MRYISKIKILICSIFIEHFNRIYFIYQNLIGDISALKNVIDNVYQQ